MLREPSALPDSPPPPPPPAPHLRLWLLLHSVTAALPYLIPRGKIPTYPPSKITTGTSILPFPRVNSLPLADPLRLRSTLGPSTRSDSEPSLDARRLLPMAKRCLTGHPWLTVPLPWRLIDCPAQLMRLVVLVSVGGGYRPETATPSMILEFFDSMILDLLDDIRFPASPPPLQILFLVKLYLFQTPSLKMGRSFCCLLARSPYVGSPWTHSTCRPNQCPMASVPCPPPHYDSINALGTVSPVYKSN